MPRFLKIDRIEVRIGINLGEVIVDGEDRYGEGVNIAARLQQLAEPGGICVSGKVSKEVEKKLAFGFEPMGEQHMKNIAEPIAVFRVNLDTPAKSNRRRRPARTIPTRALVAAALLMLVVGLGAAYTVMQWSKRNDLPLPAKPSIAVLPFDNLSGDQRLGRLADGMVTDITNNLSRFSELFVIARNSAFTYKDKSVDARQIGRELGVRYLLEGTVQGDERQFRVSTQLVEAATGKQQWSEQYDRPLNDLFAVQSDIMERIVGSIGSATGVLQRTALEDAKRRTPQSLDAYDLYLIATDLRQRIDASDNAKAEELFRKSNSFTGTRSTTDGEIVRPP